MKSFVILIFGLSIVFISCKKDEAEITPKIRTNNTVLSFTEDISEGLAKISLSLSEAVEREVSVDYSTQDSTALSGIDYESTSGTIVFAAGVKTAVINVPLIHDTTDKADVYFKLKFENPVNGIIQNPSVLIKIIDVDYTSLVWSDEFNEADLNTNWWNYEQGNNNGWGNNELQVYTDESDNVYTNSGFLHISALNPSSALYTSGRITTLGKKEYTYGRIEIRAKMPIGKGIWPALWMLGSNIGTVGWPACGEIDIMEYLGHQPELVYGTLHWNENGHKYMGGNKGLSYGNYHEDFHVFSIIWTPSRIRWMVDGQQFYERERKNTAYFPFDLPQFLIFNVAVGGNWPGYPDETTTFPQTMIVDYVRWYQ